MGMGIKEGACEEHWVRYVSDEPLGTTRKPTARSMLTNQNVKKT